MRIEVRPVNWPRIVTVLFVIALVLLFWNDPTQAAHGVRGFFHGISVATGKVSAFLGALFS